MAEEDVVVVESESDDVDYDGIIEAAFDGDESAPATETEAPEAAPEGPARDAQGKFAPRAAEAATETEQPIEGQEQATEPAPFRVRYDKTDHDLFPGATITADSIVIPLDQREALEKALGRSLKYDRQEQVVREDMLRARQSETRYKAQEQALNDGLKELFDIAAIEDPEQMAVAAVEYVWNLRANRPVIERELALARKEAELALREQISTPDPEVSREQITEMVVHSTVEYARQFQAEYPYVTKDDVEQLAAVAQRSPARFAYRVGKNPSPEEQQLGLQPGDFAQDFEAIRSELETANRWRKQMAESVEAAKKNAVTTAKGTVAPPNGTRVPPKPSKPKPKSQAQPVPGKAYDDFVENDLDALLDEAFS